MNVARYQVLPYCTENLVAFIYYGSKYSSKDYISQKPQILYLIEYLSELGVKTIVRESSYIDQNYSDDYRGYYARCFEEYPKRCSRIHVFSTEFPESELVDLIGAAEPADNPSLAQSAYKGFVVINPLPETVIGRTCLYPIPNPGQEAVFPTISWQTANLFGVPFGITSLPFQEQDHEVGACATSSISSVLNAT